MRLICQGRKSRPVPNRAFLGSQKRKAPGKLQTEALLLTRGRLVSSWIDQKIYNTRCMAPGRMTEDKSKNLLRPKVTTDTSKALEVRTRKELKYLFSRNALPSHQIQSDHHPLELVRADSSICLFLYNFVKVGSLVRI